MIDHYYGNGGSPTTKVISFLDESGNPMASYSLGEIANLSRVLTTTSSAHWYYGGFFAPDRTTLVIETIVLKCESTTTLNAQSRAEMKALEECMTALPYEELRFSMATGQLHSRTDIQKKYVDAEKRLLHELELVKAEYPPDNLSLVYVLLDLAHFYQRQNQHTKAEAFFERAIPIYRTTLGASNSSVAEAIGDAATNYRSLGDYGRAEQFYRVALTSLDKKQGDPRNAYPFAIRVYEEYAILLRKLGRYEEANSMEARATVLRSVYPDFKD